MEYLGKALSYYNDSFSRTHTNPNDSASYENPNYILVIRISLLYQYYNDSTTVIGHFSFRHRALVFNSFSAHYFINSFTSTSLDLSIHSPSTSLYIIQCLHGLKIHSRTHGRDQPDCDSYTILS